MKSDSDVLSANQVSYTVLVVIKFIVLIRVSVQIDATCCKLCPLTYKRALKLVAAKQFAVDGGSIC